MPGAELRASVTWRSTDLVAGHVQLVLRHRVQRFGLRLQDLRAMFSIALSYSFVASVLARPSTLGGAMHARQDSPAA